MTTAIVDLGGCLFYGADQHLPGVLHFATLSEWYGITESKSEVTERPTSHGAFGIGYDFRRSSAHTLTGWAYGDTWGEVLELMEGINSVVGTNLPITMTLTDDLGTSSREVSVRHISYNEDKEFNWLTFSIDVVAPNPTRQWES